MLKLSNQLLLNGVLSYTDLIIQNHGQLATKEISASSNGLKIGSNESFS